jgi:excisionase family DNA binding protein
MRRSRQQTNGEELGRCDFPNPSKAAVPRGIPFSQRLTCTIAEACEVTGLGRTKLYELIGDGQIRTTAIGRRRLVLVQSLLSLIEGDRSHANRV